MNDQRLMEALRRLDRPEAPSPEFADRLFAHLGAARRRPAARVALRRELTVLAAVLALAALVFAAAVGSELLRQRPSLTVESASPSAEPSRTPGPRQGLSVFRTNPSGPSLRVEYAVPIELDLLVDDDPVSLSFTFGERPYGYASGGGSRPEGHGVRIIDASTVRPHFNNDQPLGEDAAAFMDGLRTNRVLGEVIGPIRATTLGGRPALRADLLPQPDRVHMDTSNGIEVNLWPPSRLIVVDVGSAIVLVQIWADSEEALASWLDQSAPLIDSLRMEAVVGPAPS